MNKLLDPFKLKNLRLRNRIVSTSHAPNFVENGHPKDRYRLYHEEKAKGGVALTMIGGSTNISPESPSVFGQLYAGDDTIIPWFQRLTDGVKSHGAAVMCQITHMGRRTSWDDGDWLPVIAPSAVRERAHRAFPKVMEQEDIDRVVENFSSAARRCEQGGFDGIEILSHSHLLGQFLSPQTNFRTDDYGGNLENRMRITLHVLDAMRAAVGSDFVISIRVTGDELSKHGLTADDCVNAAKLLDRSGNVDLINVVAGAPYDDLGLAEWVRPMGLPSAPHLTIAQRIRNEVSLPILHAGGIADLATANHAVSGGYVDLVGMTRAHIADPHLIRKLRDGNEDRIRPCVGLGYCVDRVNQGKPAVCGHNAATGREQTLSHIIQSSKTSKKVVIVGGGPAGLEAARVSASRGHTVVLFEATDRLGGQLNLADKGQTRRQVKGVKDWLVNEIQTLSVDVRLNTFVEPADITKEAPDVVIIASGGWPEALRVPGGELATSAWDILSGEVRVSGNVVLIDEVGDHAASVAADKLAHEGCRVEFVTPDRTIMQDLGPTTSSVAMRDLASNGVNFQCLYDLHSISKDGNRLKVLLKNVLTDEINERVADHVVYEHGLMPLDGLYHKLKDHSLNFGQLDQNALIQGQSPFLKVNENGQFYLARIGDAVTGRNIHAAVLDAIRVCQNL